MNTPKRKSPYRIPDLKKKLQTIGIVDWDGRGIRAVLVRAEALISKHLQNPHVGLYRRECLLKIRDEFRRAIAPNITSGRNQPEPVSQLDRRKRPYFGHTRRWHTAPTRSAMHRTPADRFFVENR